MAMYVMYQICNYMYSWHKLCIFLWPLVCHLSDTYVGSEHFLHSGHLRWHLLAFQVKFSTLKYHLKAILPHRKQNRNVIEMIEDDFFGITEVKGCDCHFSKWGMYLPQFLRICISGHLALQQLCCIVLRYAKTIDRRRKKWRILL